MNVNHSQHSQLNFKNRKKNELHPSWVNGATLRVGFTFAKSNIGVTGILNWFTLFIIMKTVQNKRRKEKEHLALTVINTCIYICVDV